MRNSLYILPIVTLSLVNMAQAYNVGEQCDRGLIPDHNTINLSQVKDVCRNNPSNLVTSVKLQITKYLCLFYSDLECLKRVSSFEAKYSKSSTSSSYEPDFERMVGSRYVNSWLNGNPQSSF
ncbi:hypothetical protein K2X05_07020, partial [bacterium]|nr:hypothetical protein [bacterium]